jgi:hypothetical protein
VSDRSSDEHPPLLCDPFVEPLRMQFQISTDDGRVLGGEDRADLVQRHLLAPEGHRRGGCGAAWTPHRSVGSFGVSIHPRPAANSGMPKGIPMIVNKSIPPVTNMTEPIRIPPRLGRSGPTLRGLT